MTAIMYALDVHRLILKFIYYLERFYLFSDVLSPFIFRMLLFWRGFIFCRDFISPKLTDWTILCQMIFITIVATDVKHFRLFFIYFNFLNFFFQFLILFRIFLQNIKEILLLEVKNLCKCFRKHFAWNNASKEKIILTNVFIFSVIFVIICCIVENAYFSTGDYIELERVLRIFLHYGIIGGEKISFHEGNHLFRELIFESGFVLSNFC